MSYGIKRFMKTTAALAACLIVGFGVYLIHASAFSGGKSAYYLYSPSSQAEIKESLTIAELAALRGESATYVFGKGEEAKSEAFAQKILREYDADVCFTEEIGDTLSYYCYSPKLKGGVLLEGFRINLHIAVKAESVALGTPIIFGGY